MNHQLTRSKMHWIVQGQSVPLKMISTEEHLDNIKSMLISKQGFWNGYPASAWIKAIDAEQNYRKELGKTIMKRLSTNNVIVLKNL